MSWSPGSELTSDASSERDCLLWLQQMLEAFIGAGDRSVLAANSIEALLLDSFPDDDRFQDLLIGLASYQPLGGEYLYDQGSIRPVCAAALIQIQSQLRE
jgi:hypothetical protein